MRYKICKKSQNSPNHLPALPVWNQCSTTMVSLLEQELNAFLWLSLIAVTAFLLQRLAKVFLLWSKARRIPGPSCASFYGHGHLFSTGSSLSDILCKYHKKYGDAVKLWFGPTQLMVSIADTELIKEVLLKAEDKLPLMGRASLLTFGKSSLFSSSFQKVEYQRKSLEVKLSGVMLERACSISTELLDRLIERSEIAMSEGSINREVVSQHLAFTMLGATIFGDVFLAWPKAIVYEELLMKIAKDARFWASYAVTPFWKHKFWQYKDSRTELKCLTQELVEKSRQMGRTQFLWDSCGHGEMGDEPCEEIISLMFHGSLTMASLIADILTRLATNQHIQDKIHSEIVDMRAIHMRQDRPNVKLIPNLLATMYESIRLLPARPLLQRCSLQHDLSLKNGIVIPAGAIIVMPVQLVQRDSLYWGKDACKFNPHRFLSRNGTMEELLTVPSESAAFLSFGSGARVCIGQKLAVLAISSLFAALVENYEVRHEPAVLKTNPKPETNDSALHLLPNPNIVFVKRSTCHE